VTEPVAPWIFQVVGPLIWLAMAGFHARRTASSRQLSTAALFFIGATTMWWQEWYADWGGYLLFSSHFELMPWGDTPWTTPNKPWAVIPAYGWFFGLGLPALLAAVESVRRRRPHWNVWAAVAVVVVPIFYAIDLGIEGFATVMGWWTYANPLGPVLHTSRGSFPLLYPVMLFVLWALVTIRLFLARDDRGRWSHERLLGVDRVSEGWKRELARAGAWSATLNVLFWFLLVLPLILVRQAFGESSSLVP
jgi:hypothetical protein